MGFIAKEKIGITSENQLIHYFTKIKDKNYMIVSLDTESIWPNPTFMIKTPNKQGIQGNFLKLMKDIYDKPGTSITLSDERLKASPKTWNKTKMSAMNTSIQDCIGGSRQCSQKIIIKIRHIY